MYSSVYCKVLDFGIHQFSASKKRILPKFDGTLNIGIIRLPKIHITTILKRTNSLESSKASSSYFVEKLILKMYKIPSFNVRAISYYHTSMGIQRQL